ncbi:MAG: DUF4388 domain-containing protein [Kofleriaceae bacterium]
MNGESTPSAAQTELRGMVSDRPWGRTLAALGLRRQTGRLAISSGGKVYRIELVDGLIVGATSPLTADSIVRVAVINHLISPGLVSEIARQVEAAGEADEIEVVTRIAKLPPEHAATLHQQVILQRAARTFSLDSGEFVFRQQPATALARHAAIDVRRVICLGARSLSEQRMTDDLRTFGARFTLKLEAERELERFGLTAVEQPIIEALRAGTDLPELEVRHRDIDPRIMQAVIYTLASCDLLDATRGGAPVSAEGSAPDLAVTRTPTQRPSVAGTTTRDVGVSMSRAPTTRNPVVARTPTPLQPSVARAGTPQQPVARATTAQDPAVTRVATPRELVVTPRTPTPSVATARTPTPNVAPSPGPNVSRTGTPNIARTASGADVMARTGSGTNVVSRTGSAPNVISRTGSAPNVIMRSSAPRSSSPPYATGTTSQPALTRPDPGQTRPPSVGRTRTEPVEPLDRKALAREAFQRGESAMRADDPERAVVELTAACELDPQDVDFAGKLGWAQFCAAHDKHQVAAETRRALERAIQRSSHPDVARFLLGRMERMLGRDQVALVHFNEVLLTDPKHAEAASEVRAIEARRKR